MELIKPSTLAVKTDSTKPSTLAVNRVDQPSTLRELAKPSTLAVNRVDQA